MASFDIPSGISSANLLTFFLAFYLAYLPELAVEVRRGKLPLGPLPSRAGGAGTQLSPGAGQGFNRSMVHLRVSDVVKVLTVPLINNKMTAHKF